MSTVVVVCLFVGSAVIDAFFVCVFICVSQVYERIVIIISRRSSMHVDIAPSSCLYDAFVRVCSDLVIISCCCALSN